MASTETAIRDLLESQSEAIRMKDIDRLMSFYSPDVVYYDVVPPLQYAGTAALRGRFLHWFDGYQGPINLEMRNLHLAAGGDIAVAYWFSRAGGTLRNGQTVGSWVRATNCWQRSNHSWLIGHEHISWPVDVMSGNAVRDLVPSLPELDTSDGQ